MNRPMQPSLWCGVCGRWETQPGACDEAIDLQAAPWYDLTGTEHNSADDS
jgi:hypothetical protein